MCKRQAEVNTPTHAHPHTTTCTRACLLPSPVFEQSSLSSEPDGFADVPSTAIDETFDMEDKDEFDIITANDLLTMPSVDAEIMQSLLGKQTIEKVDIVPEMASLKSIAHMCESMEWLGLQVSDLTRILLVNPSNLKRFVKRERETL